ncbi:MAG TPA: efflux RND transporter periplasmic adaptor subunit [Methylomirabilota bacterium]|nr:efflux RND transporter periplasmic adaptor subunit [Methylomirabilota bacterium]
MRKSTASKRKERRPFAWGLLAVTALMAGLAAACRDTALPAPPPTPVRVGLAGIYDQSSGLRYSANIEAFTQVSLAFKSGGYVDRVAERTGADGRKRLLQAGDRVARGEVLAHVRDAEYADRVNSAKAQLRQARAGYDKAKLDFERASNLLKSDSVTKVQYDAAKAAYDSDAAAVENAQAGLQQATTAFNDCSLKSPLDGWVLTRQVEVGTLAGTGTPGFVLADIRLVKAVFGVPDTRINDARLGAPQTITTTSLPGEFHGRITSVSPSADPKSRVFSVEVTIPNPGERLKPGMIATLTLAGSKLAEPPTVVALSAVVRSSQHADGFAVFVVSEQGGKTVARERFVEIGDALGNMITVLKGLKPGDPVVISGGTLLKDGDEIKVIP